ncbi:hypothetical protein NUSPORA_02938 [Nucleospora cyclopteri]
MVWLFSGGCRRTWSPITESIRFSSSASTLLEGIFLVRSTLVISISFSSLIFESKSCLILRYCLVSRKEIELPEWQAIFVLLVNSVSEATFFCMFNSALLHLFVANFFYFRRRDRQGKFIKKVFLKSSQHPRGILPNLVRIAW